MDIVCNTSCILKKAYVKFNNVQNCNELLPFCPKFCPQKAEAVLEKNRVGTRYNLRPRKEDPMDQLIEDLQKIVDESLTEPEKQTVGKTTELEFGGKLGKMFTYWQTDCNCKVLKFASVSDSAQSS